MRTAIKGSVKLSYRTRVYGGSIFVMRCPVFFAFLSTFLSVSDVIVSNRDHDVITTDFIVMHIFFSVSLFFSYKSMEALLFFLPLHRMNSNPKVSHQKETQSRFEF